MTPRFPHGGASYAAGLLPVAVAALFLVGAGDAAPEGAEARRTRIAGMTQAERDHLRFNFETYQSLSEEERQRYRDLHRAVESDPALQSTLDAYQAWLQTLDPWQRDELRKEASPEKRLQLVRNFKQEQQKPGSGSPGRLGGSGASSTFAPYFGRTAEQLSPLSSTDLTALLEVVELTLSPLRPETKQKLDAALPGFERHVALIEIASNRPGTWGPGGNRWPDNALVDRMIETIADSQTRQSLQALSNDDAQRQALAGLILRSLFAEWRAEFDRSKPSDAEIQQLYMQLEQKEQDEIMRLPPDEARRRLMFKYFAEHRDELPRGYTELRRLSLRFFSRPDSRPAGSGPGFNPSGKDDRFRESFKKGDSSKGTSGGRSRTN